MLNLLEEAYSPVKRQIPPDFDTFDSFMRAVKRLDNSSTPGYPQCTEYPTIGEYLGFNGINYDEFRLNRLWFQVQQFLDGDVDLLFNVFIKEEPHKMSKILDSRYRLIVGSPLPFQVFCHMLFDFTNDALIEESYNIPSQQGIILNSGGWRTYRNLWTSQGYNIGLDKTAWDWTVPYWKICLAKELRFRLVYGINYERWEMLVEKAYRMLYYQPSLILSNGDVYMQLFGGIMKSGCVNTISDNSFMQIIDHILVCEDAGVSHIPLPVAVGDDTLQSTSNLVSPLDYMRYGSIVKSATEGLEFVGMDFKETGPEPLYFEKHLYKLPYSRTILVDLMDAMLRMYVYSPRYVIWDYLSQVLGVAGEVRSRAYYLDWYDYGLD